MGTVYRAVDTTIDVELAIKICTTISVRTKSRQPVLQ